MFWKSMQDASAGPQRACALDPEHADAVQLSKASGSAHVALENEYIHFA